MGWASCPKDFRVSSATSFGAGVAVLGGVTIGDGCVVGAGAVVTKNLPPGAIAFGIPAAVKGFREGSSAAPPSGA